VSDLVIDVASVRALPWPSDPQVQAFEDHVCYAHSWYKHLSFLEPSTFVVFLAADAGAGFDEARPRRHYGWATTAEYRHRFGHLDFMWRYPGDAGWFRDDGDSVELADELVAACSLQLDPGVSTSRDAVTVILSLWGRAARENPGWRQPDRLDADPIARLDALEDAVAAAARAHDALELHERIAWSTEPPPVAPSAAWRAALLAQEAVAAAYHVLHAPNRLRLRGALARLAELHRGTDAHTPHREDAT